MLLDETHTCFVRDGKTFCKKDYARFVVVINFLFCLPRTLKMLINATKTKRKLESFIEFYNNNISL